MTNIAIFASGSGSNAENIIRHFSDREDVFREECAWLASIDCAIPLHITRFFPCHEAAHKRKMNIEARQDK